MLAGLLSILSDIHTDEKPIYCYVQLIPTSTLPVIIKAYSHVCTLNFSKIKLSSKFSENVFLNFTISQVTGSSFMVFVASIQQPQVCIGS